MCNSCCAGYGPRFLFSSRLGRLRISFVRPTGRLFLPHDVGNYGPQRLPEKRSLHVGYRAGASGFKRLTIHGVDRGRHFKLLSAGPSEHQ